MAEHHHHHSHHKRDEASRFKDRSLRMLEFRKKLEKYIKLALLLLAIIMGVAVVIVYTIG